MPNLGYNLIKIFATFVTNTFFRDIQIIGLENIPQDQPLILFGNHNNQFLDPLLIIGAVDRQVKFIGAATSMRRPLIGHIARMIGAIPVERPQDIAFKGSGTIVLIENQIIHGLDTNFIKEIKVGDGLLIQGVNQSLNYKVPNELFVTSVITDIELEFRSEEKVENDKLTSAFKIQPKIDQARVFSSVWKALSNNNCVGIFPEGGSHDRTELLPLKAGICIMALGAMQKYKKPIYLQPVGLSYFKGHRFRSKVIIEFGIPQCISDDTLALYQKDKRTAIQNLLKDVEKYLLDVTVFAPSYSSLSALYLIRQIYLPDRKNISPKDGLELIRRVGRIFKEFAQEPEIIELRYKIKLYQQKLKHVGISDNQIKTLQKRPFIDSIMFLYSLVMTVISFIFVLPGLIMNVPIALILNYLSEQERKKALAKSKVKIHGKDIIASYKVLASMVIVPTSVVIYTLMFYHQIKDMPFAKDGLALQYSTCFFFLWPLYVTSEIFDQIIKL